jgi:hypothetical protein
MCLTEKRYWCPLNPIPQRPPRCCCHRRAAATAAKLPLLPPPPLPSFSSSSLPLSSSPFPSPLPPTVLDCWLLSMPPPSLSQPVSSSPLRRRAVAAAVAAMPTSIALLTSCLPPLPLRCPPPPLPALPAVVLTPRCPQAAKLAAATALPRPPPPPPRYRC